jgi:hypothetical protein
MKPIAVLFAAVLLSGCAFDVAPDASTVSDSVEPTADQPASVASAKVEAGKGISRALPDFVEATADQPASLASAKVEARKGIGRAPAVGR